MWNLRSDSQPVYWDFAWSRLPHQKRAVLSAALNDDDLRVRRIACEKFIQGVSNSQDMPITLDDLSTDDGVRRASEALLPQLREASSQQ